MISRREIQETNRMISEEKLDVRTITMGVSLLGCASDDLETFNRRAYDLLTRKAERLVAVGEEIGAEFGIPIVNKRISVTPIAIAAAGTGAKDYVSTAKMLDRAAKTVGVDFIGGFSALVHGGASASDEALIRSIPEALDVTDIVCASVNIGTTKGGLNMDAVKTLGETVLETARRTADRGSIGCAKLVIFCNAVEDNPFMAGAFHGVGQKDCVINVGVSGPGVVKRAIEEARGADFETLCETIKRTASRSPGRASWWRWRRPGGWTCPSASLTCRWRRHRRWATA